MFRFYLNSEFPSNPGVGKLGDSNYRNSGFFAESRFLDMKEGGGDSYFSEIKRASVSTMRNRKKV